VKFFEFWKTSHDFNSMPPFVVEMSMPPFFSLEKDHVAKATMNNKIR